MLPPRRRPAMIARAAPIGIPPVGSGWRFVMAKKLTVALPSLPSSARPGSLAPCRCGCGDTTLRTWTVGHDARHKGVLVRVIRGQMTLEDVAEWAKANYGDANKVVDAVKRDLKDAKLLKRWKIETTIEKGKVVA